MEDSMNLLKQSRRTFLKTAGVALAGAAGLGIVGCAPQGGGASGSDVATTAAGADTKWDEEFDVVVVGAGCAGQAAAITVALEGDGATCLLAEKGTMPGGNSPYCKGTVVYAEDEDAFNQYMLEMRGARSSFHLIEAWVPSQ